MDYLVSTIIVSLKDSISVNAPYWYGRLLWKDEAQAIQFGK